MSKEEYDTCRISQQNPKVVAVCDNPDRPPITITFRSVLVESWKKRLV